MVGFQPIDWREKHAHKILGPFYDPAAVYLYDNKLYITYNLTDEKSDLERSDLTELDSNVTNAVSGSDIDHYGVPGGIRTYDPRLRRPLLYPTELQAHITNTKTEWIKEDEPS